MKELMTVRLKGAVAGLTLVLASAIPGSAAVIHVPADYSTIQAAVNAAASGDEIQIAAGVYTNQVVITNKNLTLSGSPGAIIRATPDMQETLPQFDPYGTVVPLLGVFESTNVVVSGLTFEGDRLSGSQSGLFFGVWFLASGGRVENCRIIGFGGSTFGAGVGAVNPHDFGVGPVSIQVLRSTFADNTGSISLNGDIPRGSSGVWYPEQLATEFVVDDNTIIGNGTNANGRQLGIQIAAGAGGEVKRNTITDYDYVGTTAQSPWSYAITAADISDEGVGPLKPLQPVQYEGNIFLNNQRDLVLLKGDNSTIVNNSFEGHGDGYRPISLGFSGDSVMVASNRFSNFSNLKTGVVLIGGDDPDYSFSGNPFGIASNAVLTANSFTTK